MSQDGRTRAFTRVNEIVIGMVVRRYGSDRSLPVFSDCVILAIHSESGKDFMIELARPYAYALPGRDPLIGTERFKVNSQALMKHYEMVLNVSRFGDVPAKMFM